MHLLKRTLKFLAIILLFILSGCNFPRATPGPTPFPFPTSGITQPAIQAPAATAQTGTEQPAASPAPPNTGSTQPATGTGPDLNYRLNGHVTAAHLTTPPKIDGDLGDWNLTQLPVNTVVFGRSQWTGESDLSGMLMTGWDQNNLYLAGHVKDDIYVQNSHGNNLYLGDSLEVLFDANLPGDYYVISLSSDDYQLGFSPGSPNIGDNPEAYLWFPKTRAGSLTDIQSAYKATSDGYDFELAIPWNLFGITPQNNATYGFAFSISDNDLPGQNVQQSMVSTALDRQLLNPTTWGDLTLNP